MMDYCAGSCPTARACLLLDEHRTYASCDSYAKVLHAADSDLLPTFALQVLSQNSGIIDN